MQAAIGRIQIKIMNNWHQKRKDNAEEILKVCAEFEGLIQPQEVTKEVDRAWYKLNVYLRPEGLKDGWDRYRIKYEINQLGIPCYSGSCSEIYLEKAFDVKFRPQERLPNAKKLGENTIEFLVHPTLSSSDIENTCEAIRSVMRLASR